MGNKVYIWELFASVFVKPNEQRELVHSVVA